jgi:hypothetical protein
MMSCRPLAGVRDKVSELESCAETSQLNQLYGIRFCELFYVVNFDKTVGAKFLCELQKIDRQNRRRRIMNQILNEIPTRQLTEEVVQKGSTRLLSPTRPTAKQAQATSLRAK